ncbi:MAG TPA: hypothetical protein VNN25_00115 [Thermoanaerobaculia bacterium]|nr:hypothetical protein [Thermoanaerobaculia bacterium]
MCIVNRGCASSIHDRHCHLDDADCPIDDAQWRSWFHIVAPMMRIVVCRYASSIDDVHRRFMLRIVESTMRLEASMIRFP